jgi:hypothetical protein
VRLQVSDKFIPKVYQANTLSKGLRQHIKDVHSRIEPLGPSIIVTLWLIKCLYLLVKNGENCAGRVALLELGGEWLDKKILLCALFVCFQGIIEDELEIGGRGGGGGVRVRHMVGGSGELCSCSGGENGNSSGNPGKLSG